MPAKKRARDRTPSDDAVPPGSAQPGVQQPFIQLPDTPPHPAQASPAAQAPPADSGRAAVQAMSASEVVERIAALPKIDTAAVDAIREEAVDGSMLLELVLPENKEDLDVFKLLVPRGISRMRITAMVKKLCRG